MGVHQNYCGNHFAVYTYIKSLCCTPETNVICQLFFLKFFLLKLIYSVLLQLIYSVSGVQQSDSIIYILFQILFHYRLSQDIDVEEVLVVDLSYREWCVSVNPKFLIFPYLSSPFGNHKFVFYVCESVCFVNKFTCIMFFEFHI